MTTHSAGASALADLIRRSEGPTVVVGVGNELRGDDAVGPLVARRLAEALQTSPAQERLTILDCGEVPENYLGPILAGPPAQVVFCDAADFGGAPGETRLIGLHELRAPTLSTHNASLAVLSKVLAASGVREQWLIGVQPQQRAFGRACSSAVSQAADRIVTELLRGATSGPGEGATGRAKD